MYLKTFGIWVLGFLVTQFIYIVSSEASLFSGIHIFSSILALIVSFVFAYGVILPFFIERELERNINAIFGKYKIVNRWGGLTVSFGRSGDLLLLSEDIKLYKVKIEKLKIVEQLPVQLGLDL